MNYNKNIINSLPVIFYGLLSEPSWGSDKGVKIVDYYGLVAESIGLGHEYVSVLASLFTFSLFIAIGLYFKKSLNASQEITPSSRLSIRSLLELGLDFVYDMTKEQCGKNFKKHFPLMAGLFFFIIISNLSGLVPGLPPTTENFNTNLAMGLIVFLSYNLAGIREHGLSYIKQFTGPFMALAILFVPIELISHSIRPLSLAFRLLANIFCDHLLLGIFSGLVPLVLPSVFLFFGLLVSLIQSFVFVLLTGIYINMAISHDH